MHRDFESELDALYDKDKRGEVTALITQTMDDIDNLNGRSEIVRLTLLSIMKLTQEKLLAIFRVRGRPSDDFFRIELIITRAILDKSSQL
jgi:hypothetical protein